MGTTEIEYQKEQTSLLIRSRPRDIALIRPYKRRTASGGIAQLEDEPQELPTVTRYFGGTTGISSVSSFNVGTLGNRYRSIHVLIGMPGDDIQEDDYFYIGKGRYDILFVDPDTLDYQTKAVVVRYV